MTRIPARQECRYNFGVDDIDRAISTSLYFWERKYENAFVAAGVEQADLEENEVEQVKEQLISPAVYRSDEAVSCIVDATRHLMRDTHFGYQRTVNLFNEMLGELASEGISPADLKAEMKSRPGFYDSTFRLAQLAVSGSLEKAI